MCGITGVIKLDESSEDLSSQLNLMLEKIYHRGPDDGGMWFDDQHGVALGHRRLSILDLSPAGHQPMGSSCGRYVIVFNGEIYNHLELRNELDKRDHLPIGGWRGHSDTETLLASFSAWGIVKTLQSTVGMFALALWDKMEKSLTLARDRIGEKPLYYAWQKDAFLFGSELKSIRAHPSFCEEIDWLAASTFLRLSYIPAPSTIYRDIYKLLPGTYLKITQSDIQRQHLSEPNPYWSLCEVAKRGLENSFTGSFEDAADELEALVRQSVRLQSVADVRVGAFLSGGIDSSSVVAMMQSATTSKVTTFSIGMPDAKMDESMHAAAVARYFGTNHVEHVIQPQEALDLIPRLPEIWDEPFADSSQIPTYLVSYLAKQHVTVVLSGDGGDEFFLGYPQYRLYQKIWHSRIFRQLPWDVIFSALTPLQKDRKLGTFLKRSKTLVNAWRQPNAQLLNRYWLDRYRGSPVPIAEQNGVEMHQLLLLNDVASSSGLWDAGTYLPDDILVKVDRAAMANSLETRAPLLDHRIIEFAFQLPLEYKLANGVGKKVLREVLYRHVPKHIVDRPKMGFSIPLSAWLRNDLRPWAEDLISGLPDDSELFDKSAINAIWKSHISGNQENAEQLWGILSLLSFMECK